MSNTLIRLLGLLIPTSILIVASVSILQSIVPALTAYQIIFTSIGLISAFIISKINLDIFKHTTWVWYALGVIPLILTELMGVVSRGSTRWIVIFGNQFQTSEFSKLALIMFGALWLTSHDLRSIKQCFIYIGLMMLPTLLVFIQPDLGTAIMISTIAIIGIITSGTPAKNLIIFASIILMIIPIGAVSLKEYQKNRIISFLNPYQDHLGTGYNSIQASIAVGSGKLTGRGLGQGTQSHLKFLPERHTDFIYSSLVEELGFIGGLIIIATYIWLILNLINLARVAASPMQSMIALISAGLILTQTFVNIGMNMGILPITGVTLPLVSYGGSSLLSTCFILGINWSIALRAHPQSNKLEIK